MNPQMLIEEKITESIVEVTPPQRGALWLDEHVPEWYNMIDLDTFQIANARYCVLGQIGGDYYDFAREHELSGDAHKLGFTIEASGSREGWPDLQREWVEIISERQANATNHGSE